MDLSRRVVALTMRGRSLELRNLRLLPGYYLTFAHEGMQLGLYGPNGVDLVDLVPALKVHFRTKRQQALSLC